MEKNKVYIIIFGLLFLFVILFGMVNMLQNAVSRKDVPAEQFTGNPIPTENFIFPSKNPTIQQGETVSEISPTQSTERVFSYTYPIKYETLIIDYLANSRQMVVYYPSEQAPAEELFRRFLSENEANDLGKLNVKVEYIGLVRDSNEPIPGAPVE